MYSPLGLNNTLIPFAGSAKYFGLTLDSKLKYREPILNKRKQIEIKVR